MDVRRKFVAGNWKMNGSSAALGELPEMAAAAAAEPEVDVAVCPPFTLVGAAAGMALPALLIGAQDCHQEDAGAHTGCVSAAMLRQAGARVVLTGHSERRAAQCERDTEIRHKAKAAIGQGLIAITCVGETGADHAAGDAENVVAAQIWGSVTKYAQAESVIVSYEPVWAIGIGRTPALDEIAHMHALIRETLCRKLGQAIGEGIRILYGGSVTGANAGDLMRVPEVDGVLVGGASLLARDFVPIIRAAAAAGRH